MCQTSRFECLSQGRSNSTITRGQIGWLWSQSAKFLSGTFATNQTFLLEAECQSNSNTYKFSVTVSTTRLEFCLSLMSRPVPVERVLHLRVPAVLLEDVLLLELVLLLGNNSRQFEEQSDVLNIVSWHVGKPCPAGREFSEKLTIDF